MKGKVTKEYVDVDYTLTHVPMHARKTWYSIFAILLGFTFIVTTMAAGASLGTSMILSDLIKVLLLGNLILSLYVGILCWISAKTGLNTILLARYTLGKLGSKWTDIILGGTQIFWYAFQAAYMGKVFTAALGLEAYFIPITIFWSLFMGAFAIWGTKGMEIVAYASIPPFLYLAYKIPAVSIEQAGGIRELFAIEPTTTITFAAAITIVIGAFISGGTQAPNWARFAKTPRTAFTVSFMAFLIGNVVMAISGMLGGLVMQEEDMVNILIKMGIIVMAMLILIFNIWTTNTTSAYSFGVAGAEFFNKPNKVPFVIGGLIIATILATTGIYEVFISFLTILGVFVPSLGGLIIGDYLFNWRKSLPRIEDVKFRMVRYSNLSAYILATLGAYLSSVFEIGLPPLNGILLGIGLVYVMKVIFGKLGIDDNHEIKNEADFINSKDDIDIDVDVAKM
ncbi:cytosine permease [Oceanobacillus chungangensis]|uniref:Cytosine permease n=1 Tax=Oceanobacillus chungangensis TaxID=1229152 RepID=A0A3D8PVH8_9BACI|nr:cytosine permease [Oceanobacillus chungangensis]RDW19742.1 cytosine permease [Oceanobacillus chungangensis]